MLIANLWLQRTFLPREEYLSDRSSLNSSLEKIHSQIGEMVIAVKLFEANRVMLLDHEQRMRVLEQRK